MTYGDGAAWRAGPHTVYRRFAGAALDTLEHPLDGLPAVDVGAGTGAMAEELAARGAVVICTDIAHGMLRYAPGRRFVSDATALGLRERCVDLAAAGFLLSHVEEPARALAELARVVRPAGRVLATGYPAAAAHPVKQAVDAVLARFGYRPPPWYLRVKATGEARVGDPAALRAMAAAAGLARPRVHELAVSLADLPVRAVVAWRLGMAQVAGFAAGLPAADRARLIAEATAAVRGTGLDHPVRLLLLIGELD